MKYLENCIKSLLADTSSDFHICIVDNGSTDGSKEWIAASYPQIQLISLSENTGFCKAVNCGIENTKTPYVILLNNDTEVEYGFVKALEDAIEREETVFSVSAKMVDLYHKERLDGAGDLYCALGWAFARGKGKAADRYYTKSQEIFSACGGAAIYRKELLDCIGVFDENHFAYLEDCDLGYRAQLFGYRNFYEPSAVVYHAGSGVSGSRHNEFKVNLSSRNSVYLLYKNMPFLQILLNLPLLLVGFFVKYLFFIRKGLGHIYRKGLWKGVCLCFRPEGRKHKQKFSWAKLPFYMRIQIKLWENTIHRFLG